MQNLPIINSAIHIFILDYEQFRGDFEVALIQIDQCRLFFSASHYVRFCFLYCDRIILSADRVLFLGYYN